MPAPVVQQVLSSMKILMGLDGTSSGELLTTGIHSSGHISSRTFPYLDIPFPCSTSLCRQIKMHISDGTLLFLALI